MNFKFSTIMAVLAVVLSFAVSGCKYDKSNRAGGAGGASTDAEGMDISSLKSQGILHRMSTN